MYPRPNHFSDVTCMTQCPELRLQLILRMRKCPGNSRRFRPSALLQRDKTHPSTNNNEYVGIAMTKRKIRSEALVAVFTIYCLVDSTSALVPPKVMNKQYLPPPKFFTFRELSSPSSTNSPKDSFTICTYNVLHQDLISPQRYPTVKQTDVVFDPTRRLQMLRQDLKQLQPFTDLFCLEEMSPSTFAQFQQEFGSEYGSHLVKRQTNETPHHNALFYRKSKFQLMNHYRLNLHEHIQEFPEELKEHAESEFFAIANHFIFGNQKHLLVVTVHLHHDPRHDIVKYAEVCGLLTEVDRLQKELPGEDIRLVIAGDFNAQPSNQVYRLAVLGETPTRASLQEETMVRDEWLRKRQEWRPVYQHLFDQTPLRGHFSSVYAQSKSEGEQGHPRYTNLTDGFANTIDYILYGNRLKPLRLLELEAGLYEKEEFLPSLYHASDHVILWAELEC